MQDTAEQLREYKEGTADRVPPVRRLMQPVSSEDDEEAGFSYAYGKPCSSFDFLFIS